MVCDEPEKENSVNQLLEYFETIWESEKTSDGYYKVQAYEFMNMFGEHLFNGCKMPCEPTVYFLEEDLEEENDL